MRWLLISRERTHLNQDGRPHRFCGIIDPIEVRDGGERCVLNDVRAACPLKRAAGLAIPVERTPDLYVAADLVLQLGRVITGDGF